MDPRRIAPTPVHKALYKEMDELHTYARTHIHQFLSWFAFFSGINIVALGWIATATPSTKMTQLISANFIAQALLAAAACSAVYREIRAMDDRVSAILRYIDSSGISRSPLPRRLYLRSIVFVALACALLACLWVGILAGLLEEPAVGTQQAGPQAPAVGRLRPSQPTSPAAPPPPAPTPNRAVP